MSRSLHTLYVDKPMREHGLLQAIARVNRVFRDKPGGLVVDYLGLAHELKQALATYTESGGTGETALDQAEAVAVSVGEVRNLLRPVLRLRLVATGSRAKRKNGWRSCRRRRSISWRKRTARNVSCRWCAICRRLLCSRGAARRGTAHPRRRGVLPGRAAPCSMKHAPGETENSGRAGLGRSSDRLARRRAGRCHGHLRRSRAAEARHLDSLG